MAKAYQIAIVFFLSIIHCTVSIGDKVRWCTISDNENTKCWAMADALGAAGITPRMECIQGVNAAECMEKITSGDAHLITLDGGDIYHAGSVYGMKVVMGEQYDYGRHYYAVAVVHESDAALTFPALGGKKSCHTGIRKTSGWNVPIGYMINAGIMSVDDCQGDIKAAGSFFSQSCAPGALNSQYNPFNDNPHNLCELCIGDGANKCARSDHEPYYNYDGAFRCLVEEKGDVAFVKHTTVQDVIDSAPTWASGVSKNNYKLLCKNGGSRSVDDFEECNLARVVGHGVMTSASATPSDIAAYQQLLNDAQDRFTSEDDPSQFKMFDSSNYGSGSKDLMFKDSTVNLYNVNSGSYEDYLGEDYVNTVKGLSQCLENSVRWCTVGTAETEKCRAMKEAFAGANLSKVISCYQAADHVECMQLIKDGLADLVTLDGGDIYKAGEDYGLVPVAGEKYNELDGTSYYAVAVVKKDTGFTIDELKGKKSCHTGIEKTSGWNMPIGYLIESNQISPDSKKCDVVKQVGNFFSQSCVPGAKSPKYDPNNDNPQNLCSLCKNNCARSNDEPYYSYAGAFRCLAEGAGDVAFVKHTTVPDNTDGQNSEPWATALTSSNYELLCKDGSRKPVTEWRSCNLARVPSHAVMTNSNNDRSMLWSFLNEAQQRFGVSSSAGFKMFDSSDYVGSNLLFKDSTMELVDAGDKDTYRKWLGEDYYKAVRALRCEGITANSSRRVIFSPVLFFLMALIALIY